MKRTTHTFRFLGKDIAAAADAERDYRAKRAEWWASEFDKAVSAAKEKGIEVREYPVTGGMQAHMAIDATLQERINICISKRASHKAAADRFAIESAAYATQPEREYELDPDDVVYFRLAGGGRED